MNTFICKGCTKPFKAEQRREFCCLVCIDNYQDKTRDELSCMVGNAGGNGGSSRWDYLEL